jgi:hypothetical protein
MVMKKFLALASLLATSLVLATLAMPHFAALLVILLTNPVGSPLFPAAVMLALMIMATFFLPGVAA